MGPLMFILSIIIRSVLGFISQTINENKGYEGGFWWGFLLGTIGIIVVALKEEHYYRPDYNEARPLVKWKCEKCGLTNYTEACSCGNTKTTNDAIIAVKTKKDKEQEVVNALKSYKELLDTGIITQEEFDKKKAELL